MNTPIYIDIDSGYRNRIKYPLQSDFVVDRVVGSAETDPYVPSMPNNLSFQLYVSAVSSERNGLVYTQLWELTSTIGSLNDYYTTFENFYSGWYLFDEETRIAVAIVDRSTADGKLIFTTENYMRVNPSMVSGHYFVLRRDVDFVVGKVLASDPIIPNNLGYQWTKKIYLDFQIPIGEKFKLRLIFTPGYFYFVTPEIVQYDYTSNSIVVSSYDLSVPTTPNVSHVELMRFKQNNHPLEIRDQQFHSEVCYDVDLIHMILPNLKLITGRGNLLINYPYLYVEFSNVTYSPIGPMYISSNNPNIHRAMFKVMIDDPTDPTTSFFVRLRGSMTQTIKLRISDSFRVSVRLPTGEFLKQIPEDYAYPNASNPGVQYSFLFSLRRVV